MAGLKEIELRLRSVHNTKKITYAMKLVAAAKLRKAQDAVQRSRSYTEALGILLTQLRAALAKSDITHPLMEAHAEVKNVRIIVIGGARGLCGGFNANLHRKVEATIKEIRAEHPNAEISGTLLGRKPAEYFRRVGRKYAESFEDLGEDTQKWPIPEVCQRLEDEFTRGEIDEVYLVYTKFRSAMAQVAYSEKVLPLGSDLAAQQSGTPVEHSAENSVAKFEPSPEEVFAVALPRVFRSKVRQAALESKASETGARMTAMDAATKNAGELIKALSRLRNRLRQGKITSQLLDIVGGAEGVS